VECSTGWTARRGPDWWTEPKTPVSKGETNFDCRATGRLIQRLVRFGYYIYIPYIHMDIRDRDFGQTRRQTVAAIAVSYLTIFWRDSISRRMVMVATTKPAQTSLPATRACGSLCQIEMLPHGQTEREAFTCGQRRGCGWETGQTSCCLWFMSKTPLISRSATNHRKS